MATYESYKDSGVKWLGQIPSHWETGKMREFFSERKQLSQDGSEMLLSVSEYSGITPSTNDAGENVSRSASLVGYKKCKASDLIINIMLAWKRGLGISEYDGIVSPAYCVFGTQNINPRYANYLLRTDLYTAEFKRNSTGIIESRLRMYPDNFKNIVCIKPPRNEQEAIVTYLDKITGDIDRAIEAQQKMIDALNERKQIIITRAVTRGLNPDAPLRDSGIDWLGKIPQHWEIIPMRYLCKMKTGDKDTIMRDDNGKYPFYVRSPHIEHINTYSYDGEAVLMAGDGVGAGKVFHYVNGKFDYHQRVYNFHQFKRITGMFLYFYLKCNFRYKIEEGGAKSTVDSVRLPWLKAFPICVMPKDEQQSIVEHIHKSTGPIDCALSNCERMISLLLERKQIIINEVVTGKTKVI
ncbi:restriction endonuclease subunit S [uncultured Duncaniella sp.]|jgi:type I restriction enzyme S subunit|uniref:restriction endonuclease subunit S n=1 Tax=uncultured Duncaniella sp. TaxID=2768039 RepID=UPI0025AFD521|nr:restriction endonuclease subunit S [uncultured Duncaniella sp.]